MNCPPCTGRCNQGRACPARQEPEQDCWDWIDGLMRGAAKVLGWATCFALAAAATGFYLTNY